MMENGYIIVKGNLSMEEEKLLREKFKDPKVVKRMIDSGEVKFIPCDNPGNASNNTIEVKEVPTRSGEGC